MTTAPFAVLAGPPEPFEGVQPPVTESRRFWYAVNKGDTRREPILVQGGGSFRVADLEGEAGSPVPFDIFLPAHQPNDYMLLSIRGIPERFSLSSGFKAADAWLVSAREARDLQLLSPKDFTGTFNIEVQLSRGRNGERMVQLVRVSFSSNEVARRTPPPAAPAVVPPPPTSTSALLVKKADDSPSSRSSGTTTVKELELLNTAAALLQQNDITAARLIYARLAREGSLQGALTVAQTYDPVFFSQYQVTGLEPDMQKAKHWYEIAASLGSTDASLRLLALDAERR